MGTILIVGRSSRAWTDDFLARPSRCWRPARRRAMLLAWQQGGWPPGEGA
ncbi:hypothetical protein [Nakamurella endophytica]|nr:hypothetical protein [Nakamurella endophytica]